MSGEAIRAVVLLSGGGRTLENLLEKIASGGLDLHITAVASSRPDVRGLEVARAAGIPAAVFRRRDFPSVQAHNEALNAWLKPHRPRIVILAGYLCFYQQPPDFDGFVVNIHPALLPRFGGKGFYGDRVHEAVLASGEKESGCTVHLVDDQYDHGRILGQQKVEVLPGDDVHALAARVFAAECELYPRVLQELVEELRERA